MSDWPPKNDRMLGPDGHWYHGDLPDRMPPPSEPRTAPTAPLSNGPNIIIFPGAPFDVALTYGQREHTTAGGTRTLNHHRGEFFLYNGSSHQSLDIETVKSKLYWWLKRCKRRDGEKLLPVLPGQRLVNNVLDALRAAAQLDNNLDAPSWINPGPCDPKELIVCHNTSLHWPSSELVANSPNLFNTNAVDFDYRPDLGDEPPQFIRFLRDLWPDDQESIETLQELFGLFLTCDTSFQKIAMLIGPKRSGKGTIARVLGQLIGRRNICAPTLGSLGGQFGLQPVIHKTLAIIGDARIGSKTDVAAVAERLLSISGEDQISVDRKFLETWHGQLGVRFLIISNELPRFADASGALASRFVILTLKRSFYGSEDLGLLDKLTPELPMILNWAIVGLRRLMERGYFVQPASSRQQVEQLDEMSSPMLAFLREQFEPCDGGAGILVEEFWQRWQAWCKANGREHAGTKQAVATMLHAAAPYVDTQQLRTGQRQPDGRLAQQRWFVGIKPLRSRAAEEDA